MALTRMDFPSFSAEQTEQLLKVLNSGKAFVADIMGDVTGDVTGDLTGKVAGAWESFTTTPTDGEDGSAEVQFVFQDKDGNAMTDICCGQFYISESADGSTVDVADTSIVVATNGVITIVDTGAASYYNFITDATGKLGLTITAADDDYYICFCHPTKGVVVISSAVAVSGN